VVKLVLFSGQSPGLIDDEGEVLAGIRADAIMPGNRKAI
jgi:hypothetical protein